MDAMGVRRKTMRIMPPGITYERARLGKQEGEGEGRGKEEGEENRKDYVKEVWKLGEEQVHSLKLLHLRRPAAHLTNS